MRARLSAVVLIGLTVTSCSIGPGPQVEGNEFSAIASMRAINSSQASYSNTCGKGAYAASLPVLGAPLPGSNQPNLPRDLTGGAAVTKSGYVITLVPAAEASGGPSDCNGKPTYRSYYAKAEPAKFGQTGTRSFATNAANTIWQVSQATAPPEPLVPGGKATPVQ